MNTADARSLGARLVAHLDAGHVAAAYALLEPILAARTPFRLVDVIGAAAARANHETVDTLLDEIAAHRTEGGWAVIGSALRPRLAHDLSGAFARSRRYAITGDVWYAADILAERVPGPALVDDFDETLVHLTPWRADSNRWVRKMVGVAVHFWAKRASGAGGLTADAARLLAFLEPMFDEQDLDAAKGIGWGLKTLGRHYPDLVADWLVWQTDRPHRAVIRRKALTYLPSEHRARVTGG